MAEESRQRYNQASLAEELNIRDFSAVKFAEPLTDEKLRLIRR